MGDDLGRLMHELWQEVARLHLHWNEFIGLFGSKASRIELLNQTAPRFFSMIQDLFWSETMLHIARLTDPPKSMGVHPNLTIRRIAPLMDERERASL